MMGGGKPTVLVVCRPLTSFQYGFFKPNINIKDRKGRHLFGTHRFMNFVSPDDGASLRWRPDVVLMFVRLAL